MANKLLIITLLIIITVATVIIYTRSQEQKITEPTSSNQVSFICSENNGFIAEFNDAFDKLKIIERGEVTKELNKISDTPLTFADNYFSYIFVGENVQVLNLATGEISICNQPFDPNNAPYHFGDGLTESENVQTSEISILSQNIIGRWQSLDDESFTRTFSNNTSQTVVDSYNNENSDGYWVIFDKSSAVETPFEIETGETYLELFFSESPEEKFYYKITKLNPEELELIYMNNGGVLRFKSISLEVSEI